MHPEEIKAAMRMKGVTPTALAAELEIANSTMSQVISGRAVSARVMARIATIIGKPVDTIWPPKNRRPSLRRTKASKQAPALNQAPACR
ncbi:helix-turn-helix domain-containing protein [Paracidovorax valerianellae]|uniref:helix-turn-helix domain-containing protein n=1 Tax=Paracidovorax valerianellae TaxID=187868 RepID=UPI000B83FC23|nr:helix-turn-helix domain-containing protein [Paracidovorax valerianellae]